MADQAEKNEEQRLQSLHLLQRRALSDALTTLQGVQTTKQFSAFTFEDALDLQIEHIEGRTPNRINALERVNRVEQNLVKAVTDIKALPAEAFLDADEKNDVNTPV